MAVTLLLSIALADLHLYYNFGRANTVTAWLMQSPNRAALAGLGVGAALAYATL
jgi:hypothetical protein